MIDLKSKIREIVLSVESIIAASEEIADETDLREIGIDSIDFISIIVEIEEQFGILIPDDKLVITQAGTIEKLCNIVLEASKTIILSENLL